MILGIDIGGTNIKIGVVKNKKISQKIVIKTVKDKVLESIYESLEKNGIEIKKIEKIGFCVPGFIDKKTGVVIKSGNLEWENYDFLKEAKKIFGKNCILLNDANAAALGEFWVNSDQNFKSIIFYTLGTGVGGGIIIDGKIIEGSRGFAGELGHGGFFQNILKCTCGLNNCIEPVSSAKGIEMNLSKKLGKLQLLKK